MSIAAKRIFCLKALLELNAWRWPASRIYTTQCQLREQAAYVIGWMAS
jgi:hypothetical protein